MRSEIAYDGDPAPVLCSLLVMRNDDRWTSRLVVSVRVRTHRGHLSLGQLGHPNSRLSELRRVDVVVEVDGAATALDLAHDEPCWALARDEEPPRVTVWRQHHVIRPRAVDGVCKRRIKLDRRNAVDEMTGTVVLDRRGCDRRRICHRDVAAVRFGEMKEAAVVEQVAGTVDVHEVVVILIGADERVPLRTGGAVGRASDDTDVPSLDFGAVAARISGRDIESKACRAERIDRRVTACRETDDSNAGTARRL